LDIINDPNKIPVERLTEAQQQTAAYDNFFRGLSPIVSALIADEMEGKNVVESMKKYIGTIDYSKPVTAYTEDQLILMTNTEYTEDELVDLDPKVKKSLYNAGKTTYEQNHQAIGKREAELKAKTFDGAKIYNQSIEESIADLKQRMPNLEPEKINAIVNKMKEGYHFYDGQKYKKDAAYKIAHAEYGEQFVKSVQQQFMEQSARQIQLEINKTTEQMLAANTNDNLKKSSATLPVVNPQEELKNKNFNFEDNTKKK
jgi:hypothetical protein